MALLKVFICFCFCIATALGHGVPEFDLHPEMPRTQVQNRQGFAGRTETPESWVTSAQDSIAEKLNRPRIETRAKNLILMIGDGMGLSTVTAARIMKGQDEGLLGEEGTLHMETFPYVGTAKTFCNDVQVADSACTSTAYSAGYKGNIRTIGVTPAVLFQDCFNSTLQENRVTSVLAWAQSQGMSTGIVTNTAITDASPAGAYAHVADRNWENDQEIISDGEDPDVCYDIARQLVEQSPGNLINVILGAGRKHFLNNTVEDPEDAGVTGERGDGRNLMDQWSANKPAGRWNRVTTATELLAVNTAETDYLLGLFASTHMAYADTREAENDPTLAEMVDVAIQILSRNANGFYLFVEGGNIDKAHHGNRAKRALVETVDFDLAIQKADNLTNDDDTLIVVSADHSHLLNIAGTPDRGHRIFGFVGDDAEGNPATTLSYVNGPGHIKPSVDDACSRTSMDDHEKNLEGIEYRQMATYSLSSATHAGEDVLIFAKGPFAHLFTGINDQTFIAHAMRHAREADEAPVGTEPPAAGTDPPTTETDPPTTETDPPASTTPSSSATHMTMSVGLATVLTLLNYFR